MSEAEYLKNIGEKIRKARHERKLPLRELSALVGIRRVNLNYIELGRRNLHILTLCKIADALRMDVKDFL